MNKDPLDVSPVEFPKTVMAAGVIWICSGGLILLNMLLNTLLLLLLMRVDAANGVRAAIVFGLWSLFGVAFIHLGVKSVRGSVSDTLGNGIGSIIFGGFSLNAGMVQGAWGQPTLGLLTVSAGVGLVAAGILAHIGRAKYRSWRKVDKARRRAVSEYLAKVEVDGESE